MSEKCKSYLCRPNANYGMRKALLIGVSLIVFLGLGTGFEVTVNQVEGTATTDQPGEFQIQVENTGNSEDSYRLNILDYHRSQWYNYDTRLTVEPGETDFFNVQINPGSEAVQDRYSADFSVRESSTDTLFRDSFNFRVTRDRELNLETFSLSHDEAEPGDSVEASATVRNVAPSTLEDPEIIFSGLETTVTSDLGPITGGGTRSVTESFEVDGFESPGEKEIVLEVGDRSYTETFEVMETGNVSENVETENRVFVVNNIYRFENTGNTPANHSFEVDIPSYLEPVTYAPEAEVTDGSSGQKTLTWRNSLEPGESVTVESRTDYWIPITGLAVLLGSFLLLRKITSSVSVVKTVEERESENIVTLEVENSSSKTYDDVLLEDYVPNIASVNSSFDMASPEVVDEEHGTKLKWWITDLGPGDQRIFKYTLRPKVEVEEGITLDPAELKDGDEILSRTDQVDTGFRPE